jgi:DNA-binding MarR family transcriptional regulator
MSLIVKKDQSIIRAIGATLISASKIAEKTGFGRTTVSYRLKLMEKEGLVSRKRVHGREVLYTVNKRAVNQARESRLIEVFEGSQILQAYRTMVYAKPKSVVYSVQGLDALRKLFKIFPEDYLAKVHRIQKRRNILLEGFVNKQAVDFLKDVDAKKIQSHIGRAVGVKLIEGDLFLGPCEVLCSKSAFLICNLKKKQAIILKEKQMAGLLFEILALLYHISDQVRVFHLNDYLKRLMEEKR